MKQEHIRKSWDFDTRGSRPGGGVAEGTGQVDEVETKSAFYPWIITPAPLRVYLPHWRGYDYFLRPAICPPRAWMVVASRRVTRVVGRDGGDRGTLRVCSASAARLPHRLWSNWYCVYLYICKG